MNFRYQETNLSIVNTLQVSFLEVVFVNIVQDSKAHKLITRLQVAQKEFQKMREWERPVGELISKAAELSSILETLMDTVDEIPYDRKFDFADKVIESSCAVMEQYEAALSVEGFVENIIEELKTYTKNCYERYFSAHMSRQFWFDLQCYEWFLKGGWIRNTVRQYRPLPYAYHFSDAELEAFFSANRTEIIRTMLEHGDGSSQIRYDSPLAKNEVEQAYRLHKRINF